MIRMRVVPLMILASGLWLGSLAIAEEPAAVPAEPAAAATTTPPAEKEAPPTEPVGDGTDEEPITPAFNFEPPTPQILTWVANLGDDDFNIREHATNELIHAGMPAIGAVVNAGCGDDPEVGLRAVTILLEIFRVGDDAEADAAEAGLEQILDKGSSSTRRRADRALSLHAGRRMDRALAAITKLGGTVKMVNPNDANGAITVLRANGAEPLVLSHVLLAREWKGGDQGLAYLKRVPNLSVVYVTPDAKVTPEALDDLRRAMPDLQVQTRGRACLGVSCDLNLPVCQVRFVQPDSAADQAGLRSGDIIQQFDGTEIDSFEAMVELIKGKNAGDKVPLKVNRGGQVTTIDVTLGEWK